MLPLPRTFWCDRCGASWLGREISLDAAVCAKPPDGWWVVAEDSRGGHILTFCGTACVEAFIDERKKVRDAARDRVLAYLGDAAKTTPEEEEEIFAEIFQACRRLPAGALCGEICRRSLGFLVHRPADGYCTRHDWRKPTCHSPEEF